MLADPDYTWTAAQRLGFRTLLGVPMLRDCTKRKALEGGADTLLTKPIDFLVLRNEIDTRVAQAA